MATETNIQQRERKRKRTIYLVNGICILIVTGVLAWCTIVYFHLDSGVYTNDAQVESYINPINTRIPGYVFEIRFNEHQRVKKGDTLVIIDDREYRIQVKQAEAAVLDAQANKNINLAGVDIARNSIGISSANIDEVKARLDNARVNYRRFASLLKEDVVTQFQFDQVKADLDGIQAKYNSLLLQETSSQLITTETGKRVSSSNANIKRAEAGLEQARLNLSYTIITAPYDGVLGRKIIEEGQFVQPGESLVSIVRGNERWVTANYTESQLHSIRIGQKVVITIDALGGKTFSGEVTAVSEASGSRYSSIPVDNATGNFVKVQQRFPIRINFIQRNPTEDLSLLKPGMNAEVELDK